MFFHFLFYRLLMPIDFIKHTAEACYFSMSRMASIQAIFTCSCRNCLMIAVFHSTWTCPVGNELFTGTTFTIFLYNVMCLIGMFASTLEILWSINWKVNIILTFTARSFAFYFSPTFTQIVMVFIKVIAETFCC